MIHRRFWLVAVLLGTSLGCRRDNRVVVVASKNFTEQIVLGEIAAQQIEKQTHLPVRRKLDLGGTLLTHLAIVRGDIDVYPEYTGTAAAVVLKQQLPPNEQAAYQQVRQAYLQRFNILWLAPIGFNDTFAMVVRRADAEKLGGVTLSAAKSRSWRLGIGYEFLTRSDGFHRLNQVYGIPWNGSPRSMDLGLLYQALDEGSVDMAAGNSTDPQLNESSKVALADDRHAFPPYNACFLLRNETAQSKPEVLAALNQLSGRINDARMRELNSMVQAEHKPVSEVARQFLATLPQ